MINRSNLLLVAALLCMSSAGSSEIVAWEEDQSDLPTGIRMHYVETGNRAGEKVLLLHGYTDTNRSYHSTIEELTRLRPDLHIFALDQRGHGRSSMPNEERCAHAPEECFRMSDFAADVRAFMDLKKIQVANIVGHSMGSLVAQEFALTSPERVGRMVLIATTADMSHNPVIDEFLTPVLIGPWEASLAKKGFKIPQDIYRMTAADANPDASRVLLENWVNEPLADPAFLAAVLPETTRTPLGTWIGCLRSLSKMNNVERLKDLKVPTLVIWATQDVVFRMKDQTILRNSLAIASKRHGTRYFWKQYGKKPLPESGTPDQEIAHNTQWAAPKAVAADLAAFLQENGQPVRNLPYAAESASGWNVDFAEEPVIEEAPK